MEVQDDDDLVGSVNYGPRFRRQQRAERADDLLETMVRQKAMGVNPKTGGPIVEDMMAGVTVSWLSQVFGMDPKTVKAKLADCPPLHRRKAGYVYALPVACQYLVKPALSMDQFLKNLKATDLPASMQQMFWDAALKRQKWEENAGVLWRTEKVREVLGSTFQTIKFTVQLWADTLERQVGLTAEQRELLVRLVDELQEEIYKALVASAKSKRTGPQIAEIKEMLADELPPNLDPVDEPEDNDWADLV